MSEKVAIDYRNELNQFITEKGFVELKGKRYETPLDNELKDIIDAALSKDAEVSKKASDELLEIIEASTTFQRASDAIIEELENTDSETSQKIKDIQHSTPESEVNFARMLRGAASNMYNVTSTSISASKTIGLNVLGKYPLGILRGFGDDRDTLIGSRRLKATLQDDLVSLTRGKVSTVNGRYNNINRAQDDADMERRIARRLSTYSRRESTINADGSRNHYLKDGIFSKNQPVIVEGENNLSMNMSNPEKGIHAMVLLAKQKGWDSVVIDHVPEKYRDLLTSELAAAGISVKNEVNLSISNATMPAQEEAQEESPNQDKQEKPKTEHYVTEETRLNTLRSDLDVCKKLASAGIIKPVAKFGPDGSESFSHYAAPKGASIEKILEKLPNAFQGTKYDRDEIDKKHTVKSKFNDSGLGLT